MSGDLVAEAKAATDNRSGVVESLLADFLSGERERLADVADDARATAAS